MFRLLLCTYPYWQHNLCIYTFTAMALLRTFSCSLPNITMVSSHILSHFFHHLIASRQITVVIFSWLPNSRENPQLLYWCEPWGPHEGNRRERGDEEGWKMPWPVPRMNFGSNWALRRTNRAHLGPKWRAHSVRDGWWGRYCLISIPTSSQNSKIFWFCWLRYSKLWVGSSESDRADRRKATK